MQTQVRNLNSIRFEGEVWPPKLIAALRKKGMSQRAIGSRIGLSQPFISQLESGKRADLEFKPGMRLLGLFAEVVLDSNVAFARKGKRTKN